MRGVCCRCGARATADLLPLTLRACAECERAWLRDESLSTESVIEAIGEFGKSGRGYVEHLKAFAAELLKRTEAWAKASES